MATAGLLLSDDLLWSSKIVETARALEREVRTARDMDQLAKLAAELKPQVVILDLNTRNIDAKAAVEKVKAIASDTRFFAFGRHTDVDGLRAARDAGCNPVLPRSALVEKLPDYLRDWLA